MQAFSEAYESYLSRDMVIAKIKATQPDWETATKVLSLDDELKLKSQLRAFLEAQFEQTKADLAKVGVFDA